ncbi:MAG: MlaD family protein [Candidatus Dormibacteria bacterium]
MQRALVSVTAFAAVAAGGIFGVHGLLPGGDAYTLLIPMSSAAGLYPGSDVLIAGAHAGSVQDITLDGDHVLVTIAVDGADAPVHTDASAALRPKSLLGEKYVALDPGSAAGTLASGTTLSAAQVTGTVELQDVANSLDAPTRAKLQTLVVELGGGLLGRGADMNQGFQAGAQDLTDLSSVTAALSQRDRDLETVITTLDQVLAELAQSDRRQELGALLTNSQQLLADLSSQDQQVKTLLANANASLARQNAGLAGTAPALGDILRNVPTLVSNTSQLTADFGSGLDTLLAPDPYNRSQPLFLQLEKGIDEGPMVFGGKDASGYATRVSVQFGGNGVGVPGAPASTPGAGATGADIGHDVYSFLLGVTPAVAVPSVPVNVP